MSGIGAGSGEMHVVNEIEHDARGLAHVLVENVRVGQRGEEVVEAEIHLGLVPYEVVVLEQELRLLRLDLAQILGVVLVYANVVWPARHHNGGCCLGARHNNLSGRIW